MPENFEEWCEEYGGSHSEGLCNFDAGTYAEVDGQSITANAEVGGRPQIVEGQSFDVMPQGNLYVRDENRRWSLEALHSVTGETVLSATKLQDPQVDAL